jgi:hypothetical protein
MGGTIPLLPPYAQKFHYQLGVQCLLLHVAAVHFGYLHGAHWQYLNNGLADPVQTEGNMPWPQMFGYGIFNSVVLTHTVFFNVFF